ncbi:hypothetical protein STAFG_0619 [Streptomyces afghaniensis 772]|uniref:Uncharacterized protein n=1 Tax=Streptomyces afghaniensis 772 TaxID=1283301 RepID=S4N117_9ACTN|nr:hypothetical protein STAFG_0619 [Streptomyces afghaniensis 772]
MQDSTPYAVGIDVGGTKTHLRAFAGDEDVVDHVRSSSGWRPHDPGAAADWLAALVAGALPSHVRPSALAVGGHACETPRQCAGIRAALQGRLGVPALVVGDAELLVPAAGWTRASDWSPVPVRSRWGGCPTALRSRSAAGRGASGTRARGRPRP